MKMIRLKLPAFLLALTAGISAVVAEPTVKVGDPAPKLQTGKWVQGDPVTDFKSDSAYVVEFWATWCGPCKMSIPHLNEKYLKYKDKGLTVIGVDCWEKNEALVAPFVKTMGEKMTYRVVLDDKEGNEKGKMAETWMEAAGQNGIPSAFLIDKTGHIAWIGHPMELKDETIDSVLAGTYDVKKAAAEFDVAAKKQAEEQAEAMKMQSKIQPLAKALGTAMKDKNWDEALAKVDEIEKLLPESQKETANTVRLGIYIQKKDMTAVYKFADAHADSAMVQNEIAWRIATDPAIENRDLAMAEKFALRANELSKNKEPGIMDTLARVYFMHDKKDEAIAVETKAVALADGEMKDSLQKSLDSYKKGELPKAD